MALRDLLAIFDVDTGEAEKGMHRVDSLISGTVEKIHSLGEAFAGALAIHEVSEFLKDQIEIGSRLNDTAERLGVGAQELQKFQQAAKLSGVDTEAAAHSLGFLNKAIGEAATGGEEQRKVFQKLGIAYKDTDGSVRPTLDVVADLADGFDQLDSHQEKAAYAMKLFGRQGAALLPVLGEGREGLEKLFQEFEADGSIMGEDFVREADAAGDALDRLKFVAQGFKSRIAVAVLPTFTAVIDKIRGIVTGAIAWTKNTYTIQSALAAFGAIGSFAFLRLALSAGRLLGVIGGAKGVIGNLLSLGKLAFIIGIVTALYLVFDDLYTLFQGGESVIGELLDELFGIGTAETVVETLKQAWEDLVAWWKTDGADTIQFIARLLVGTLVVAIDLLITSVRELGLAFKFAWDSIAGSITDADKDLKKMGDLADEFGTRFDKIAKFVGGGAGPRGEVQVGAIQTLSNPTVPVPPAAGGGGATTVQTGQNTITINQNIQGGDPKAVGAATAGGVNDGMNQANIKAREALKRGSGG